MDTELTDTVFPWMAVAVFCTLWAAWAWGQHLTGVSVHPAIQTLLAVAVIILAARRVFAFRARAARMHQGMLGEQVVGQYLETLRSQGYEVFHDIQEDGYNLDHVLIGPTGVYAIETKTISKPAERSAVIVYDGQRVLVGGHTPDRDPLAQAEASADRVGEILEAGLAERVFVRPVVLFPGWFIRKTCTSPRIWVVNEQYFQAWLDQEKGTLEPAVVQRYAAAMATHVRARQRIAAMPPA